MYLYELEVTIRTLVFDYPRHLPAASLKINGQEVDKSAQFKDGSASDFPENSSAAALSSVGSSRTDLELNPDQE